MDIFIITISIVTLASSACFALNAQGRAHKKIVESKDAEIARLTTDNLDLRNRMFQSKNMPPSGTDLAKEFKEDKEEREEQRQKNRETPQGVGPLEKARMDAVARERTNVGAIA